MKYLTLFAVALCGWMAGQVIGQTITSLTFVQAQAKAEALYPGKGMTAEVRHSGTTLIERVIGYDSGFRTIVPTASLLGRNWATVVNGIDPANAIPKTVDLPNPIAVVATFAAESMTAKPCNPQSSVFGGSQPAPPLTCQLSEANTRIRAGLKELCNASPQVCTAIQAKYKFNLPQ